MSFGDSDEEINLNEIPSYQEPEEKKIAKNKKEGEKSNKERKTKTNSNNNSANGKLLLPKQRPLLLKQFTRKLMLKLEKLHKELNHKPRNQLERKFLKPMEV